MTQDNKDEALSLRDSVEKKFTITKLQLEVAKLKTQGLSFPQIARKLEEMYGKKFEPNNLNRGFLDFVETAKQLRGTFQELQKARFWDFLLDRKKLGQEQRVRQLETQKELFLNNIWPFGRGSGRPWGTEIDENRKLFYGLGKETILKRLFQRAEAGKEPTSTIAKDEDINDGTLRNILKNPYYAGFIEWQGKIEPMKTPNAIINKKTWDNVQKILAIKRPPKPRIGFRRSASGIEVDPEKIEMLRDVCRRRQNNKSYGAIAAEFKITSQQAWQIIHDPAYRDIVGADLWTVAQGVKFDDFGGNFTKKRVRKRALDQREETQRRIVLYLQKRGPSRSIDIATDLKVNRSTAQWHLRHLKGLPRPAVGREPGQHGKWFLVDSGK